MADLRAISQNPVLGAASGGLRSLRSGLDVVPLPEFLGGGLGQALIGKAPEEVERWSYGESPFQKNPTHSPYIPQLKPERMQGVADTALLPIAETAALGKLAGRGLRSGYEAAMNVPEAMGRREFVKKAGAVAGTTAAAGLAPSLVTKTLRAVDSVKPIAAVDVAKPAASVAAKAIARASPHEFYKMYLMHESLTKKMLDEAYKPYRKLMEEAHGIDKTNFLKTPEGKRWQASSDALFGRDDAGVGFPHWSEVAETPHLDEVGRIIEDDLNQIRKARQAELDKVRSDPKYEGYKTPKEVEDMWWGQIVDKDNAYTKAGVSNHPRADELVDAYRKTIGWKPDEEVEKALKTGEKYIDPETQLHAVLDKFNQLTWFSPRTGSSARHRHWVNDDFTRPETMTYDRVVPQNHVFGDPNVPF